MNTHEIIILGSFGAAGLVLLCWLHGYTHGIRAARRMAEDRRNNILDREHEARMSKEAA